jgi:hypothetical protein
LIPQEKKTPNGAHRAQPLTGGQSRGQVSGRLPVAALLYLVTPFIIHALVVLFVPGLRRGGGHLFYIFIFP